MGIKIGLAGDWHGNTRFARHVIAKFAESDVRNIIQLGDFGLGWPGGWNQYINEVEGACTKHHVHLNVVEGNHENYDWMAENLDYSDGTGLAKITKHVSVCNRGAIFDLPHDRTLMTLGGAPSIDFQFRTVRGSWWPEEMLTLEDVRAAAEQGHVDIMLAHDAPSVGTDEVMAIINMPPHKSVWSNSALAYAREGRLLMDMAFEGVKPKFFAHGHYHVFGEKRVDGTQFLSLDCDGTRNNAAILDLETLEYEMLDLALDR